MNKLKLFSIVILVVISSFGLIWLIEGNDFFLYKYFAPKEENVRREVFENTKSYKDGMVQELQNMQFEYIKADSTHKIALASIILHRAAEIDETKLPQDLRTFIDKLKDEQKSK